VYLKEQTEVLQKEVIHERPIIHEKDIYFVEKPVFIEKPEIVERPMMRQEQPQFVHEQTIRREMRADDLTIPAEAMIHQERLVVQEVPVFIKEKPEIFEKELIFEKPIIHQQPVIYTERQEIHEKPEFIEKRGYILEQPIVQKLEPVFVRSDDQNLENIQRSTILTTNTQQTTFEAPRTSTITGRESNLQSRTQGQQQGSNVNQPQINPVSDLA
jgi:hypothetical protein